MGVFNAELFYGALNVYAYKMSDRAIEPYLKQEIIKFLGTDFDTCGVYDMCCRLHDAPFDRLPGDPRITGGDIDAFGHELFNVKKHYIRPEPGTKVDMSKVPDLEPH